MSSNYPQRNKDLNMETTVGVRVLKSQREKLEEHALKNKMRMTAAGCKESCRSTLRD